MTAAEKILQKALAASGLDSSQWNRVQAGLRDRAFFSSQVASARILHALREQVAAATEGAKSDSEIRRDIREYISQAGYNPGEARGTIKDLFTKSRLDVIIDTNRRQARGFAQHMEATTNGALRAFPAYELVRVYERKQKRNWLARWIQAGGKVYLGNRMIALKTDPIWSRISAFGSPYPPFDWGSGMGVEDVGRGECLDLGVIDEDTPDQTPPTPDFNSGMQAEVPMHDDAPEAQKLKDVFGDQIRFDGNIVHWQGELIQDVLDGKVKKTTLGVGYNGKKLSISHNYYKEHLEKHVGENEKRSDSIPVTRQDYDLLPTIWRSPDRVNEGHSGRNVLELDAMDGGTLCLIVDDKFGIKSFYKRKISQERRSALPASERRSTST